jgi:endonuclease III-like uncharacterized protein
MRHYLKDAFPSLFFFYQLANVSQYKEGLAIADRGFYKRKTAPLEAFSDRVIKHYNNPFVYRII